MNPSSLSICSISPLITRVANPPSEVPKTRMRIGVTEGSRVIANARNAARIVELKPIDHRNDPKLFFMLVPI